MVFKSIFLLNQVIVFVANKKDNIMLQRATSLNSLNAVTGIITKSTSNIEKMANKFKHTKPDVEEQPLKQTQITGEKSGVFSSTVKKKKKKEKQVNEMRSNLKVGDEIVTIGGIHGTICKVKDEYLTIQVGADKTKLEMTRWSVSRVVSNDPAPRKAAAQEERP